MSDDSVTHPNLGLTGGWSDGDTWGAKHNANTRRLDVLVQGAVKDKDLTAPPGSPANGDRYIVGASPTGAWSTHADDVAVYDGAAWVFYTPKEGWFVWVNDEDVIYAFDGAAWGEFSGGGSVTPRVHKSPGEFSGNGTVGTIGTGTESVSCYHIPHANGVAVTSFVVPDGMTSLSSAKLLYANEGTSSAQVVTYLGIRKLVAGEDATQDPPSGGWGAGNFTTPPTTAEQIDVVTMALPTLALTPGDVMRVIIWRPSALDANTSDMALLGLELE